MNENPYSVTNSVDPNVNQENKTQIDSFSVSSETRQTLVFAGQLIRGVAAICGVFSLFHLFATVMGFYYLSSPSNWTWLHTMQAFRLSYPPALAAICFFGWKYANSINKLMTNRTDDMGDFANAQAYFWLIIVLYLFLVVCGLGLSFSASYAM